MIITRLFPDGNVTLIIKLEFSLLVIVAQSEIQNFVELWN